MSKEKNPSDNDLREVTVEVPRHKKHRRETEPSGRHKHRREAELSGVKVDSGRQAQCSGAEPNDMKKNAIRPKQRRESELGVVDTHKRSRQAAPTGVKVVGDRHKQRRNTHTADAVPYDEVKRSKKISSRSNDYAFDNNAFDGSLNNVNETRNIRIQVPLTSVYREQYWACTKWSFAKKVLAVTVGVVMGAGIGLAIILVVTGKDAQDVIDGILQVSLSPD